ncbi:hypothetical protein SLA2020_124210 [Shorea laevis]
MQLPKDFQVDLPNSISVKQKQKAKRLRRSTPVKVVFTKPASESKGATSLQNLPPLGFNENSALFVFGKTQDVSLPATEDRLAHTLEIPMQQEATLVDQVTALTSPSDG